MESVMGNITKLPNGKYKTTVYDIYGKRHRMTFVRKSEADAYISNIEIQKHESKLIRNKLRKERVPILTALDNFNASKIDLRFKTRQKYNNFTKQFKLFINAVNVQYVDEFTTDHATLLFNELIREKVDPKGNTDKIVKPSSRTVNYYLRTARTFFNVEVLNGHIDKNPLRAIKNLRVEKKPPEFYTKEEINNFFSQKMHFRYRNAFTVLLHTGMRFAELANLTWDDIDLERRLIKVRPKEEFKTKTYNSIRNIPMDDHVYNMLTSLVNEVKKTEYPFCSVEGKKLRERPLYYHCQRLGLKAGIKGQISLHKFRHSFASHLVQNRVPIEYVQKLLGHSTINETMIYAHLRSDDLHEEVKVLDNLFN